MPNVGYAVLQVIPSVRGIADNIRSQLNAPMQQAGQDAGASAGEGILSGVGGKLKGGMLAVGAAAGAVFVKGFGNALEQGQVTSHLRATLGATPQQAEQYGKVAGKLYSNAVSDTFADAADAIKGVVQQGLVPPGATNKQLESIATKAANVANIMGEDVGRTTAAVSTILKTGLAPNADAAFDILTRGIQTGVNKNEDLLDTFTEYPVQFQKLGLSAESAMGLLSQGLKAGARDSDFLADALKEFSIRAVDGSKTSADAFKLLGLDAGKLTAQIARGGPEASAGLQTVLDRLRAMKDPVQQNAAAVGLFGTKAEDLGASLLALNPATAVSALGQVAGAADQVGVALGESAGARIEVFKRTLEQAVTEFIGGKVIPGMIAFGGAARDAGRFIRDDLVPPVQVFGGYLADNLGPAASDVGGVLEKYLVPPAMALRDVAVQVGPPLGAVALVLGTGLLTAAEAVGRFLVETLIPALASFVVWLDANREKIGIAAAVIGTILLPVLIQLGVRMVIVMGQAIAAFAAQIAGWVASAAAAVVNAAITVAAWVLVGGYAVAQAARSVIASWSTVGGWIASAASAVVNAAIIVGSWILVGAQAVAGAARAAVGYAMVIGGWIASAAAAVANAAVIVGSWILMGVQSLIQAGRMAAAWFIALGPVGWVIASIIGLTAIIITNWDTVKRVTTQVFTEVAGWARWLYDQFANWFGKIGDKVGQVVGGFKAGFQLAKDGIAEVWNGMGEVAAAPVRFVVDKVYNNGIAKVWNWIAGKVGLPQLDPVPLAFATGGVVPAGSYGVLPGYAPGRDTMLAAVSPGEAWLRPEAARWLGSDAINALNYKARTGGLPAFGLGGIVGKAVGTLKKVPGVGAVVEFAEDLARGALAKAAEKMLGPVRGLINSLPGSSEWAQGIKGLPMSAIDGVIDWLKGQDKRDGGEGVQRALEWARGQAGKPYQWGGGGNPSWDCSGFMAAIQQVMLGNPPSRLYTTFDFVGAAAPPGWKENAQAPFMVGVTNVGSGHMAGTIAGVNVESRGGDGIVVGAGARGWNDPLFYEHYGYVGTHDSGGWMMPGVPAINRTPKPEAVLTNAQWRSVHDLAANRQQMEDLLREVADRAPLIGTYNAAKDDDPYVLAESFRALQRGRRGPRA